MTKEGVFDELLERATGNLVHRAQVFSEIAQAATLEDRKISAATAARRSNPFRLDKPCGGFCAETSGALTLVGATLSGGSCGRGC